LARGLDRLVVELRLAGASTPFAGQCDLAGLSATRRVPSLPSKPPRRDWPIVLCHRQGSVRPCSASSMHARWRLPNTVHLGEHRLQLLPDQERRSYARTHVEVHERLDGSLAVYSAGRCLVSTPAPLEAPVLRARGKPRARTCPTSALSGSRTDQHRCQLPGDCPGGGTAWVHSRPGSSTVARNCYRLQRLGRCPRSARDELASWAQQKPAVFLLSIRCKNSQARLRADLGSAGSLPGCASQVQRVWHTVHRLMERNRTQYREVIQSLNS